MGGLIPGIKVGRSRAQLPLKVEVEEITVPEGFVQKLNDHLLLVYTGKTRLARNLLQVSPGPRREGSRWLSWAQILIAPLLPHVQDVLRSWYARLPAVVQNAHSLVRQTEKCAEAFRQGEVLLPWRLGHQSKCLVTCGSEARELCGLGTGHRYEAPGDRSLLSGFPRVSHPGGSHISGQHLHHGEGFQPHLPGSR